MRNLEEDQSSPGEAAGTSPIRVLLVEDELLVAMMAEDMLSEMGHRVWVVQDVAGALSSLAANAFDLAILDVNLSGSTSEPVADALSSAGIPFLFVTGYGLQGVPLAHCARPVLPKPYDQQGLTRAITAVLSGDNVDKSEPAPEPKRRG